MSKENESDFRPPRGFLSGIKFGYFMDWYGEWHAFCQGLFEVLCPWPPRHKRMSTILKQEIEDEHHYYMFGRALGVLVWIVTIIIIVLAFK